jgi:CheY-like chemotaxis protein
MSSGFRRKAPIVLFVEDCSEICELHGAALEHAGLLVRRAATIAQACEMLAIGTPDLIVMDRDLPDGDGFELASQLKSSDETRHVLVIGFTASAARSAMNEAHAAGMDGFVVKPCPPQKLVALTRLLLGPGAREAPARAC